MMVKFDFFVHTRNANRGLRDERVAVEGAAAAAASFDDVDDDDGDRFPPDIMAARLRRDRETAVRRPSNHPAPRLIGAGI